MKILMSEALPFKGLLRVGSHELASQFMAHGHDVFWVGFAYHLIGALKGMLGRARHRPAYQWWRRGPVSIGPSSWAYHPISALPFRDVPGLRSPTVLRHSLRFTVPRLSRVIRSHGFAEPDLLWLSQSPGSAGLLKMVRPRQLAYRMSDRYGEFSGVLPAAVEAERELLERADVVFATARGLLEDLPASVRSKGVYLPNGVDLAHFTAKAEDSTGEQEPADLAELPSPRVIFVGCIADWVDLDLVAEAARELPKVSFVLIGPVETDPEVVSSLANVRLVGPRDYADVPGYLRNADVGIIPFKRTPLTEVANPVKLYQYFAAGLPVVATRLDEIERMASPALLASSASELVAQLRRALERGRDAPEYATFAARNTWEARYEAVREALGSSP